MVGCRVKAKGLHNHTSYKSCWDVLQGFDLHRQQYLNTCFAVRTKGSGGRNRTQGQAGLGGVSDTSSARF